MMNRAIIIIGCAKGESRYQKLLYEEYYSILMKVAFRYVSTYKQALDLTQTGFIKIFREFIGPRFEQDAITKETLFAWIKKTFIVSLVDHMKPALDLYKSRPIPGNIWNEYDRPLTENEMLYVNLIKGLKELPTVKRLVFNLHVLDGFTHGEIAGMLGITVDGSKQNLIRARESLNKLFLREKHI